MYAISESPLHALLESPLHALDYSAVAAVFETRALVLPCCGVALGIETLRHYFDTTEEVIRTLCPDMPDVFRDDDGNPIHWLSAKFEYWPYQEYPDNRITLSWNRYTNAQSSSGWDSGAENPGTIPAESAIEVITNTAAEVKVRGYKVAGCDSITLTFSNPVTYRGVMEEIVSSLPDVPFTEGGAVDGATTKDGSGDLTPIGVVPDIKAFGAAVDLFTIDTTRAGLGSFVDQLIPENTDYGFPRYFVGVSRRFTMTDLNWYLEQTQWPMDIGDKVDYINLRGDYSDPPSPVAIEVVPVANKLVQITISPSLPVNSFKSLEIKTGNPSRTMDEWNFPMDYPDQPMDAQ